MFIAVACVYHFTPFRFGSCEQYEQGSDLCNAYYNGTDYVYIPCSMTQSQIAATLSRIPTSVSATAECRDNVLRILCHNFFAPCGRNGTIYLPTSICQEECSYVRDTCQTFWNQTFQTIESELGTVDCETPGSASSPLPRCCTDLGISIPTTSELWQPPSTLDSDLHPVSLFHIATSSYQAAPSPEVTSSYQAAPSPEVTSSYPAASSHTTSIPSSSTSEATSFQISASIIGGAMGGALILVILLLVLVIIIAAVLVQRRKAAVQNLQLEVLAR